MNLQEFTISSAGGQRQLHVCQWTPDGAVRAVVQLTHGMCEHILRYSPLAEVLTARGFAVIGHDHLGHGYTALDADDLGIFPADHPSQTLADDIRKVSAVAKARFPGKSVFLLGHSMGSFLARSMRTHRASLESVSYSSHAPRFGITVQLNSSVPTLSCVI